MKPDTCILTFHRIDFDLLNFNPAYTIETSEPSPGYENYYTPGTPEKGVTSVHHFKTVTYKDIYPKVDLEFLVDEIKGFKYNFVVHPGGNLSSIKMNIKGTEIEITGSGSMLLKTSLGTIEEEIPNCKYFQNSCEIAVIGKFVRVGPNQFGFSVNNKIPDLSTVIIDPIPVRLWGTYYGGFGQDDL